MIGLTNDRLTFLFKFIQSPTHIGSITPSSSFLAKKMFEQISWDTMDAIVELGAGTGVFTRYIHQQKKESTKAIIIEKDAQMRKELQASFPSCYFSSDAEKLDSLLQKLNIPQVDCIISGLPFANFSPELRIEIMNAVMDCLKPGGLFIAFQYSLQMKTMLKQYFKKMDIAFELFNFPPAFIYTCEKQ
ncbi:class I SAM-dependent methyltransferase [Ammoniphilus sp. 3BR4]|uniref:class I SAM-dependent methyltransferase n=1 Tax=Ammoniphilus sp. 3BR4 TaxID=3158265 RepID=UPI0034669346